MDTASSKVENEEAFEEAKIYLIWLKTISLPSRLNSLKVLDELDLLKGFLANHLFHTEFLQCLLV